jgi:fructose/tagatose bisphosphate aldolase
MSKDETELRELRRRAFTTTWLSISTYLRSMGTQVEVDVTGIDVRENGSALKILKRIKDMKNISSCKFFSENTGRILFASNIPSFHGSHWKYTQI